VIKHWLHPAECESEFEVQPRIEDKCRLDGGLSKTGAMLACENASIDCSSF
jgi:hypothetical protein